MTSWGNSFPDNPEEDNGRFFHRLTIFIISSYCHGRKVIPIHCFKRRNLDGNIFQMFNEEEEGGGKEMWASFKAMAPLFANKQIRAVTFMICSKNVSDPFETLRFTFSYEKLGDSTPPSSAPDSQHSFDELKSSVIDNLKRVGAVAKALHKSAHIPEIYFPLKFQLRFELSNKLNEEPEVDEEKFELINADPEEHKMEGRGIDDIAFKINLGEYGGMQACYCTTLIRSLSEVGSVVTSEVNNAMQDHTVFYEEQSDLNYS